jgi:hypothetical protein
MATAASSSSSIGGVVITNATAESAEFTRNVQASCMKLQENYKMLIKRAMISEDRSVQRHEELQIQACAESIVRRRLPSEQIVVYLLYCYFVLGVPLPKFTEQDSRPSCKSHPSTAKG